jgi:ATP-dependent RNA helicase RhlE
MERELKVKFEWSEADKNLEKEERNKPLDLTSNPGNLLALETRAWKSGDASAQTQSRSLGSNNQGSSPYKGDSRGGFRGRAGGGGRSSAGRSSSSGRPGSSRAGSHSSGPARRGQ